MMNSISSYTTLNFKRTSAAEYIDSPLCARPIVAVGECASLVPTKFRLTLMDNKPFPNETIPNDLKGNELEYITCDFRSYNESWSNKFRNAYVAFLFPPPHNSQTIDGTWMDMRAQFNLIEACSVGNVERVVMIGAPMQQTSPVQLKNKTTNHYSRDAMFTKMTLETNILSKLEAGTLKCAVILQVIPAHEDAETISKRHQALWSQISGKLVNVSFLPDANLDSVVDYCVSPGLDVENNQLIIANVIT
jgi:hypothetical protein